MKRMLNKVQEFVRRHRQDLTLCGVLLVVATAFVFLFSISTSPLYEDYYAFGGLNDGGDSMQFQTIGSSWLHGKVPYRDTFDHKGPLIFLINCIGFWLGNGSRYGLIPLQIIFLTFTLFFIWKVSQLAKKSNLWGGITVGLTLIFMVAGYAAGNSVQEYNLAFIVPAIYLMLKYFYQKEPAEHNPRHALIYGVAIGACLLFQLTHAIMLCVGILVIVILLLWKKLWKNLGQNLLYGLGGVLAIWLPFALYFLVQGAFGDFIYDSLVFNFAYASGIGSWLHETNGAEVQFFITTYIPFFCVLVAGILACARQRKPLAAVLLLTGVLEAYLFISAQMYTQYVMAIIFQVAIFLNEVILFEHRDEVRRFCYIGAGALITVISYNQFMTDTALLIDRYNAVRKAGVVGIGYEELIDKHLDEISQSSFLTYGGDEFKGVYLRCGLVPHNKFFVIQPWHAKFAGKIKTEIAENLDSDKPEYLLVDESAFDQEYGIATLLKSSYRKVEQADKYILYQLK